MQCTTLISQLPPSFNICITALWLISLVTYLNILFNLCSFVYLSDILQIEIWQKTGTAFGPNLFPVYSTEQCKPTHLLVWLSRQIIEKRQTNDREYSRLFCLVVGCDDSWFPVEIITSLLVWLTRMLPHILITFLHYTLIHYIYIYSATYPRGFSVFQSCRGFGQC